LAQLAGENPVSASRPDKASGGNTRGLVGFFSRLREERGQGVIEFAMVVPLLAILIFVMIDFGKAVYYYIDLTHVANEGARIATVTPATLPGGAATFSAYICNQLGDSAKSELRKGSSTVDKAKVTLSYDSAAGADLGNDTGDPVTVEVSTKYHWIPWTKLAAMTLGGSATMRIENPASATGSTLFTSGSTTCS
jgi:Flp pilus assembly protein TadG